MKLKLLFSVLILLVASSFVWAQKQNEVTASVIFVRENPNFNTASFKYNKSTDQIGGSLSYTRFSSTRPVGVVVEVADSASGRSATAANLATATVGVVFKSRTARIAPFLKGEVGGARLAARNAILKFDRSDVGFAAIAGVGVDVRLNQAIQLRILEVDYIGTRILGSTVPHVRVGAGLTFRF